MFDITAGIDPEKQYTLNEALRLTPLKSYLTIKKCVKNGELIASRVDWGYAVKGSDLISFLEHRYKPSEVKNEPESVEALETT